MTSVEDPFAEAGPGFGKMDKVVAKKIPPPVNFELLIRRIAEIEDELARRGTDPLIKERDKLRKVLKDAMVREETDKAYDETSNWEAVIQQRSSDSWNVDRLKAMLTPAQRGRYIVETVADGAVRDGVKNGDLSRGELEAEGAVTKAPGARALYVRERREDSTRNGQ